MINSAFKRTNVNFKISTKLNKSFDFVFNTRLSNSIIDGPSVSSGSGATTKLRNVVKYAPTRGLRGFDQSLDDDDNLNSPESASLLLDPVLSIKNEYRAQYRFSNLYNGVINWNILKGLRFSTNVNYNFLSNRDEQVWTQGTGTSRDNGGQPVAQKNYDTGSSWSVSNTLTYDLKKGQNRYNFLLGQEVTNSQTDRTTALSKFFPVDKTVTEVLAAMSNGTPLPTYTNIGEPVRLSSLFGRINISMADKYLLTLTAREDGASVFSPQKKWGFFPGAAFAWRASEEEFLLDQRDWLSNLKVRVSYGAVGNSRVGTYWRQDYGYVDLTRTKTYYPNENIENAIVASNTLRNPDLTWETTITQNIGLDFGVFNNRLSGTLELYRNRTKDLIVAMPLPTASGYTQQFQNVGQTSNRGVELALNAYIIERKDFTLSANFNISFNKNNIDKFSSGDNKWKLYGSGWNGSAEPAFDYLVEEGGPVGQMYGYVTEGYYTFEDFTWNTTTKNWDLNPGVASNSSLISAGRYFGPGALKLKDIAGGPDKSPDGKITEDDRTVIGNANPIHTGGFGLNATYKGFDLAAFFNWSYGNDIYNANKIDNTSYLLTRRYQNLSEEMSLDKRFTTIDPVTGYNVFFGNNGDPARLAELNQNKSIWHPIMTTTVFHSWAVEDGSFIRLNNLTLGYSLPAKLAKKMHMENLRMYATGYNLFILTNYSGPDPEVSTRRSTPLTPGVDYSAYPKARSFVAGVNVTF
jgi:TonB-linked SusC/RagA family outer membrane protein